MPKDATNVANATSANGNRTLQNDIEVMEERITAILLGQNKTANEYFSSIASFTWPEKKPTTSPVTEIRYVSEGVNWAFITPAILIGVFLVVLGSCLYWQSWKEKRRMRNFMEQQRATQVSNQLSPEGRLSIRSLDSQRSRGSSTCERIATVPLRRQGSKFVHRPEEEVRKVSTVSRPLSPIVEMAHHRSADALIRSEEESLRPITSNFQVSWGTPQASGGETKLSGLRGYENPCFSAPGKLTGNVYCEECHGINSPYYPNNNTPTNEYEADSDKSVLIAKNVDDLGSNTTHVETFPLHVYHYDQNQLASMNTEEISSIHPEHSHPPFLLCHPAHSSSTSASSSLSLPSSISRFHASRTIGTPNYPFASTRNCSPMRLNFTLSSSIEVSDHFSDNTSMIPCVGSSNTSTGTQATSGTNPRNSVYSDDLYQQAAEMGLKCASAPETRRPSLEVVPDTRSYSVDVDLFRSVSLTTDSHGGQSHLSSSISYSMTPGIPHNPTPVSYLTECDTASPGEKIPSLDENQNMQCFDMSAIPGRRVKFSVPVLDKKQYWV